VRSTGKNMNKTEPFILLMRILIGASIRKNSMGITPEI
jgi:hypothetical protein